MVGTTTDVTVTLRNAAGSPANMKWVLNNFVTFDRRVTVPSSVPGILQNFNLSVASGFGETGQGSSVARKWSRAQGIVYFEAAWTALADTGLTGGIGLLDTSAFDTGADPSQVNAAIAADGTNGIIFRPNGSVYETVPNGNGVSPVLPPWPLLWNTDDGITPKPCHQNDILGIMVDFDRFAPTWLAVTLLGLSGTIEGKSAGTFFPKWSTYVPCVVFDTSPADQAFEVLTNFGASPFIGPSIFPGQFDGVVGWQP